MRCEAGPVNSFCPRSRRGHRGPASLLMFFLLAAMPLVILAVPTVSASSSTFHQATVFYLHNGGDIFGNMSRRYDWANTTRPYNPPDPYFQSDSYQGIEINSTRPINSFEWIAYPAVDADETISGNISVTLFASVSNSTQAVDLQVSLLNVSGSSVQTIAFQSTGNIYISPNQRLQLTLHPAAGYELAAGSTLVLNATRVDTSSNALYIEFDYNSTPSSFSLNLSSRLSSPALSIVPSHPFDNSAVQLNANVSDALGSSDIYRATLYVSSSSIAFNTTMNASKTGGYFIMFTSSLHLTYGSYSATVVAYSQPEMNGTYTQAVSTINFTVYPSLDYFAVKLPAYIAAGRQFNVSATAYADNGAVMTDFNSSATVSFLIANLSSSMTESFHSGLLEMNYTVNVSGLLHVQVSAENATGSASSTVIPGPVSRIVVQPSNVTVAAGRSVQFSAYGYDAFGNLNSTWSPYWSASGGGTVNSSGVYNATTSGNWKVYAQDNATGAISSANVSVGDASLFSISIQPAISNLTAGGTYFFHATGRDAYGNSINLTQVIWSTDAGLLQTNGSEAVLTASRLTFNGAYIEAESSGLTARISVNITPSAFSPVLLSPVPVQMIPAGSYGALNLSPFFSVPYGVQMEWFSASGNDSVFALGQGIMGNTTMLIYTARNTGGYSNLSVEVTDSLGYSTETVIQVKILPVPNWSSDFPAQLDVQYAVPYILNYTYFVSVEGGALSLHTSSAYVKVTGNNLYYSFPSSFVNREVTVIITAVSSFNTSSSVAQVVRIVDYPPPILDTAEAPPSSITIDSGATVSLPSPLTEYFISRHPLSFTFFARNVSARNVSGLLYISAPEHFSTSEGSVLVEAAYSHSEAFLHISVNIVDLLRPPVVAKLPEIRVHYSSAGVNYAFPLTGFVTDYSVPISETTVITDSSYISFDQGNFSLLFSMPANASGGDIYTGPYVYSTNLTFIGGPLNQIESDSATVSIAVLVSNIYPPSLNESNPLPSLIEMPENSVHSIYLMQHIASDAQAVTFSVNASVPYRLFSNGTLELMPAEYYFGYSDISVEVNSSGGFLIYDMVLYVYEVNIPPTINLPSTLTVQPGPNVINLTPYISNPNGEPLTLEAIGSGAETSGNLLIISLPSGVRQEDIKIIAVAGGQVVKSTVIVRAAAQPLTPFEIPALSLAAVLIVVAAVLAARRRRLNSAQVAGALLIHRDGRLMASSFRSGTLGSDGDLFAGILSALDSFISSSFSRTAGQLKLESVDLSGTKMRVIRGRSVYIVLIYTGNAGRKLLRKVQGKLEEIEQMYPGIEFWDGRSDTVEGVENIIDGIVQLSS